MYTYIVLYHVHSTSFGIFFQLIKPMLSNLLFIRIIYASIIIYRYMLILVSIEKNQMYTKYYSYHNVSTLYSKIPRIYIILGNLKSEYNIIIIYSLTAIYLEVQLCTTCKVVKYRNNIINIIHNLLCSIFMDSLLVNHCYVAFKKYLLTLMS